MKVQKVVSQRVVSNLAVYNGDVLFVDQQGTINFLLTPTLELRKSGIKMMGFIANEANKIFVSQHYLCLVSKRYLDIYSLKDDEIVHHLKARGTYVTENIHETGGIIYVEDFSAQESVLNIVNIASRVVRKIIVEPCEIVRAADSFLVYTSTRTPGIINLVSLDDHQTSSLDLSVKSIFEDFGGKQKTGRVQKAFIPDAGGSIIVQMLAFYVAEITLNIPTEIKWMIRLDERATGESIYLSPFVYHFTGSYCYKIEVDLGEVVSKTKLSEDILRGMGTLKKIVSNESKSLLLTTGLGVFNLVENETGKVLEQSSTGKQFSQKACVVNVNTSYFINDLEGNIFCIELDL